MNRKLAPSYQSKILGRVMDDSTGCGCKRRTATDPGSHPDIHNSAGPRLLIQPLQLDSVDIRIVVRTNAEMANSAPRVSPQIGAAAAPVFQADSRDGLRVFPNHRPALSPA